MASNKSTGLKPTLLVLAEYFSSNHGWLVDSCSKVVLNMSHQCAENIHHYLLIMKSPALTGPPPQGFGAVNCRLMVSFTELEDLINRCLQYEANGNSVSVFASLSHVGNPQHLHNGEYFLVDTLHGVDGHATGQFLRDCEDYLEPVRRQLNSDDAFLHDDYVPSGSCFWSWNLRRLAHARLYGDTTRWKTFASDLEARARTILTESPAASHDSPRIFNNVEMLKSYGEQRAVQEVLDFISSLSSDSCSKA